MSEDASDARAVIDEYVEACRVGSVERLIDIFHPNALMSGYFNNEFASGSPQPFFDEVRDNPSPQASGTAYGGTITYSERVGDCASVTLSESGFLGMDFTNWFHLVRVDDVWKIISKTYIDRH